MISNDQLLMQIDKHLNYAKIVAMSKQRGKRSLQFEHYAI